MYHINAPMRKETVLTSVGQYLFEKCSYQKIIKREILIIKQPNTLLEINLRSIVQCEVIYKSIR